MQHDTLSLQAVSASPNDLSNTLIEWVTEGNVSDSTSLEECEWPDALGSVNDLVWNHKIARLDMLLQASHSRESNDGSHADRPQSSNVGSSRHLVGSNLMVKAVTAQEGDSDILAVSRALVVEDSDRSGGLAPGSRDIQGRNLRETREFPESGTTDDGDPDGLYIRGKKVR